MLRRVEERFGCKVSLRQLFGDIQTPAALAAHLAANASARTPPEAAATPATGAVIAAAVDVPQTLAPAPVAPVSADTVSAPRATTAVERLITEQLAVMRSQLELLAGGAASGAGPVVVEPAPAARPAGRPASSRPAAPLAPGARGGAGLAESEERVRYLKVLAERFGSRTKGSKEFAQRFRPLIADSRSSIGFRPTTKEMLYPIVAERGQGARLWDIDGNEYVDLTLGWASTSSGTTRPLSWRPCASGWTSDSSSPRAPRWSRR